MLFFVFRIAGQIDGRGEGGELAGDEFAEGLVVNNLVLGILAAPVDVDGELGRPLVREGGGIDRNAVDFDLNMDVLAAGVASRAAESNRVETIHPLVLRDEHLLISQVKDLADDVLAVTDADEVARTAVALLVTLDAVGTDAFHDAGGDREDGVDAVFVVGDVAIPPFVAVVGASGLPAFGRDFAADVFDDVRRVVEIEEGGRTSLTGVGTVLRVDPVFVERIGEDHLLRVAVGESPEELREETSTERDDDEQPDLALHDKPPVASEKGNGRL